MKTKRNPIHHTVTNWISKRPRKSKTRITLLSFFNDLENRGPFSPNSLFRQWTSSIRREMIELNTWPKGNKLSSKRQIVFVQEYISRLQFKFWTIEDHLCCRHNERHQIVCPYWSDKLNQDAIRTFKMIYKMIRIFGLRMKMFCLLKPRLYKCMKYRRLLVKSVITDYIFGKRYTEKAWSYFWTLRNKSLRKHIYFCAPISMEINPWC